LGNETLEALLLVLEGPGPGGPWSWRALVLEGPGPGGPWFRGPWSWRALAQRALVQRALVKRKGPL